jgi:hypothetical protein
MKTKIGKRILAVTLKRILDDSPDTSYYGEYSQRPTSRFSIDRAHAKDCASLETNHRQGVDILEHVRSYLQTLRDTVFAQDPEPGPDELEALDAAYDTVASLQQDISECDCGERGDMQRNEYRYFNPSFNYVTASGEPQDLSEEDVIKYTRQDYERMEAYNGQQWWYLGIRAEAKIGIGDSYLTTQTITSGGLWGIESDSSPCDFAEVSGEELADLKTQLLALGFSKRAVSQAFKPENIKESE